MNRPSLAAKSPGIDHRDAHPSLAKHRENFPALSNKAYFNYGAEGPLPETSLEAICESYRWLQRWGPFSTETQVWLHQELESTRRAFASQLGAPPDSVLLTESVSVACNIVLWGLPWKPGDHLLLSDSENPGVIAAAQETALRHRLELSFFQAGSARRPEDAVRALAAAIRPRTRLVVLSHVLWNTGLRFNLPETLEALRHPGGRPRILIDGAQSVGVAPLAVSTAGIDFYAFTGQKWLCGPGGLAGLYLRPDLVRHIRPTFCGWRSLDHRSQESRQSNREDVRRFEIGSSAYPLGAGLRRSLQCHDNWGSPQTRQRRIQWLAGLLWGELTRMSGRLGSHRIRCSLDSAPEAGIVSFQLPDACPRDLVFWLESEGILVRSMPNPECVRACVHYLTTRREIEKLIEHTEAFLRSSGTGQNRRQPRRPVQE